MDEALGEVGVDAPIALFVGIGQGAARHGAPDAHVVELGALGAQAGFDVAQALSIGELGEGHAAVVLDTPEALDPAVALIALDAPPKGRHR